MSLLTLDLLANIGRQSQAQREIVTRRYIRKYALVNASRQIKDIDGKQSPPIFHAR